MTGVIGVTPGNVLAIETATDAVGAALLVPGGSVVERVHLGGREHAERLAPAIEEVCAASGCPLDAVDVIAVDVGPGLFTGLRVGVATAKALSQGLGVGVVPVSSLDVLAAAAAAAAAANGTVGAVATVAAVAAVVDARRGEVFVATYEEADLSATALPGARRPGVTDQATAMGPDQLPAWFEAVGARSGGLTVVGDGAVRYAETLGPVPGVDLRLATQLAVPSPGVLARLATDRLIAGGQARAADEIVPDYRRPADARINWEQRVAPQSPSAGPSTS